MSYQMRRAKGSTNPVKYPQFDSPAHHGWTKRRTDSDGVIIWELRENAQTIAAMKPNQNGWCDVAILPDSNDPQWVEIDGSYAEVTSAARRLYLELIDEDDKIFSSAIDWDDSERVDCQKCHANIPNDGNCWYCEQIPFLGEPMYSGNPAMDEEGL